MPEWLKITMLLLIYLGFAPLAGVMLRPYRDGQRAVFFLMMFLTMLHYRLISTSPGFPHDFFYRGHTRGFECTLMEVMAMILLFSGRGPARLQGPWIPPGFWLYLLYCFAALLSIFNSPNPSFTLMAFVKFSKVVVVFMAAFHFFREEEDIHFWLKSSSVILIFQALVCLVQKYHFHIHQVHAWFEHQNSMVMYTYLLALPILSVALLPLRNLRDTSLYIAGFVSAGICAVMALSRAGMVAFATGAGIVVFLSFLDRITFKRMAIVSAMSFLTVLGAIFVAHSVIARFEAGVNFFSENTRELLNESSREMIADHPLLGTGWNTYGIMINPPYDYGNNFDEFARSIGHSRYVDSQFGKPISESWYYLVMAETGMLGIATLLLFALTLLFWSGRAVWKYRHTFLGAVAIGLFAGLCMNYFQSNYERVLTQPKNMAAWMICLGLVARIEWWRRQKHLCKAPACTMVTTPASPIAVIPRPVPTTSRAVIISPPGPHIRPHPG